MDDTNKQEVPVTPPVTPTPDVPPQDPVTPPVQGSETGAITTTEFVMAFLTQRLLWVAGILWAGVIDAALYLKDNWEIMQGSVPWWLMVAAMAIVGTLLAINGFISGKRRADEIRDTDTRVS